MKRPTGWAPGRRAVARRTHGSRSSHARSHRRMPGFTLIEVLVALSITAIALAAGAQASNALTRNAQRQSDMLLAQICAENELVRLRLTPTMPPFGDAAAVCEQAGTRLEVTVSTTPTLNPSLRRVDVQVRDAQQWPVLRLVTVLGPY